MKENSTLVLLGIVLLFLIFTKACDTSQDKLLEYMENQNKELSGKFDSLQATIGSLELQVIQKDTIIYNYRTYYNEIAQKIDSVTDNSVIRDSIRVKLRELGSARFDKKLPE